MRKNRVYDEWSATMPLPCVFLPLSVSEAVSFRADFQSASRSPHPDTTRGRSGWRCVRFESGGCTAYRSHSNSSMLTQTRTCRCRRRECRAECPAPSSGGGPSAAPALQFVPEAGQCADYILYTLWRNADCPQHSVAVITSDSGRQSSGGVNREPATLRVSRSRYGDDDDDDRSVPFPRPSTGVFTALWLSTVL